MSRLCSLLFVVHSVKSKVRGLFKVIAFQRWTHSRSKKIKKGVFCLRIDTVRALFGRAQETSKFWRAGIIGWMGVQVSKIRYTREEKGDRRCEAAKRPFCLVFANPPWQTRERADGSDRWCVQCDLMCMTDCTRVRSYKIWWRQGLADPYLLQIANSCSEKLEETKGHLFLAWWR